MLENNDLIPGKLYRIHDPEFGKPSLHFHNKNTGVWTFGGTMKNLSVIMFLSEDLIGSGTLWPSYRKKVLYKNKVGYLNSSCALIKI